MKHRTLWKVSVTTTVEAEDAVAEMLFRVFGTAASTYTDAETRATTVAVFCERRPSQLETKRIALRAGLCKIKVCGLDIGLGRIRVQEIPREDWAESWKRHFQPIEIGEALLIKPSWSKRRASPSQAVVVLDPGLSFGTGQHPTTAFCLWELARARRRAGESPLSFLDIGTGSGILAIAAARLGYAPVHAFDFDPEAVRVARTNAKENGVSSKIRITRADLTRLPRHGERPYDVVCANLIANLLIAERGRILARVRPGGVLVLAGILKREFTEVRRAFEAAGWRLTRSKAQREWRSGTYLRSPVV